MLRGCSSKRKMFEVQKNAQLSIIVEMTIMNDILVVNQLISSTSRFLYQQKKRSLTRWNAKNIAVERKEKDSVIVEQISVTGYSFCHFQ